MDYVGYILYGWVASVISAFFIGTLLGIIAGMTVKTYRYILPVNK